MNIYLVLHGGYPIFMTTVEANVVEFLRRRPDITAVCVRRDGEVGGDNMYRIMSRADFGLDA